MQTLTSSMLTALVPRTSAGSVSRNRDLLFEIYDSSFYPTAGVFDPSLALYRWAKAEVVWLGNTYDRRIVSHSPFVQSMSGQFNNGTLTIENADGFLAAFVLNNIVDGMRLVVRYMDATGSTSLADSVVCFVGRLMSPDNSELDREQGDLIAREELASLDMEIPKRFVGPEDPDGRSPNDPLYRGFTFKARPSSVRFVVSTTTRKFFFFTGHKDTIKYNQWSSQTETDNAPIPLILGRAQRDGLPVFWVDIGFYIVGIWVYAGHKISALADFHLPDSNYIFYGPYSSEITRQAHVHLGDPGGTGTNATPDNIENTYPQNTALLSNTAYVGFYVGGPESATQPFANPNMDNVPTLVAIVLGDCDLPDGGGVFNQRGFSDSPVYLARLALTANEFFGLDPRLVEDSTLPTLHAERQRPIIDKSNGELLFVTSHDAAALVDQSLIRLASSGVLDARYFRHLLDGTQPNPLTASRSDAFSIFTGTPTTPAGGDQQLTNGVSLGGQTVGASAWKYYYIDVPLGATELQVAATGSGDGTTFLRSGNKPTISLYDTFAYSASPEICTVNNPASGRWWVGMAGFHPDGSSAAGLSFSLLATILDGGGLNLPQTVVVARKAYTLNVAVTDTVNMIDFFNNVILASARMYRLTNAFGRQELRAKKSADSTYLTSSATGGTAATGTVTVNTLPADGDTITFNGINFIFRTSPSLGSEIAIGANVNATVDTLAFVLTNSHDGLLTGATYVNSGGGVLTVTHDVGAAGNSYTLAKVSSHITLSGATLSGGTDGATSVSIANVEPWRASLQGYLLINVGLATSETRKVTSALYNATLGNTIGLVVSGTGLTASGATLSGGSTSVPSSGTITVSGGAGTLTVTIFGISFTYTVETADNDNSIAAILTTFINADPNIRQYVRATWANDNIVHIFSTVGTLGFAAGLVNSHPAHVASPTAAPTASAVGSGTLTPGNYYLGYSLVDGSGDETLISPLQKIVIGASQKVSVTSLGALPSGASSVNWYFSPAHDDDHVLFFVNNSGGSFTINAVADFDQDRPLEQNETGAETIRVMEVFNQYNTLAGSFKWVPSASKINQITGSFIDAAGGFQATPITVNDRAHQRAIKQINKLEINLSGVDSFSQASRLCFATLAEHRDGGEGAKWVTDEAGIPLEIGDVVAVNAYRWDNSRVSAYIVNQPIVIQETSLDNDLNVSFSGTVYATSLMEGQTGRKPIIIANTLRYFTEPPPVATNLALVQAESFFTGVIVDFDFADWAHTQLVHVFVKGPSFATPAVEPSDSTYKLVDAVYPDANRHGHMEYRATSAGTYWFKIVTQSTFGQSEASGHPVASILIRPPAPTNLALLKLAGNDRVLTWQPAVPGAFLPETYIVRVKDSGSSALKRTTTIAVGDHGIPANWAYLSGGGNQAKVTIPGDGSISTVPSVGSTGLVYKSQVYYGDGDVEFEIDDRQFFGFRIINDGTSDNVAILTIANSSLPQFIDADATPAWRRRLKAGTKLTLRITNGALEYRYDDAFWAFAGLLLKPPAATFYLRAEFFSDPSDPPTNEAQAYLRVRFLPSNPRQWVYSDGMAKEDFASVNPSTVKFEVTQISASGIESLVATVTG